VLRYSTGCNYAEFAKNKLETDVQMRKLIIIMHIKITCNIIYNIIYIIIKNENINFEIIDVIIALLHLFT